MIYNGCDRGLCIRGCGRQDRQLNTYDWLADVPGNAKSTDLVEVQFKNTRKGYYHNVNNLDLKKGDIVAVEASPGHDIGVVTLTGKLVELQIRKANIKSADDIKRIYRIAKPVDMEKYREAKSREHDTMIRSRQIAKSLNLDMKIGDVEYQGDGNKAIFYYIADECAHRDETDRCKAGSRTHRRYRAVRSRAVLCNMDEELCVGKYGRGALSGHITQPAEAGWNVCKTEVLLELRGRQLHGSEPQVAEQGGCAADAGQ